MSERQNYTNKEIAAGNDLFRSTMILSPRHQLVLSEGVAALDQEILSEVITAVREFSEFSPDNDPHREHDFGAVEVAGTKYIWKIDYYDREWRYGADPYMELPSRLLTIMKASEY